jgi:ribonucleoside-triphosphate reductase
MPTAGGKHNNGGGCMKNDKCSVEVFARVTGFFRPVQSWNKGKTQEFKDRKKYLLEREKEKV